MNPSSLPLETVAAYLGEGVSRPAPHSLARYVSKGMLCAIDLPGAKEDWEVQTTALHERVLVHAQSALRVRVFVDATPALIDPRRYLDKISRWMHYVEPQESIAGASRGGDPSALVLLQGTDPFGRPLSVLAACTLGKGRMYAAIASAPQDEFRDISDLATSAVLGIRPL